MIELIEKAKSHWSTPSPAIHKGKEIPFKLQCEFSIGASESTLNRTELVLPEDFKEFIKNSDGAVLFKDKMYGQWGLKILSLNDAERETTNFHSDRNLDAKKGDVIIGSFIGDSDSLLMRCDLDSHDFGWILAVSAIDPRDEWEIVSKSFKDFFARYLNVQGDKYWE